MTCTPGDLPETFTQSRVKTWELQIPNPLQNLQMLMVFFVTCESCELPNLIQAWNFETMPNFPLGSHLYLWFLKVDSQGTGSPMHQTAPSVQALMVPKRCPSFGQIEREREPKKKHQ